VLSYLHRVEVPKRATLPYVGWARRKPDKIQVSKTKLKHNVKAPFFKAFGGLSLIRAIIKSD